MAGEEQEGAPPTGLDERQRALQHAVGVVRITRVGHARRQVGRRIALVVERTILTALVDLGESELSAVHVAP